MDVDALYRIAEAQLDDPAAWWRLGAALAERAHVREDRVAAIVALRHAASLDADDDVLGQIAGTFVALGEYEAAYQNLVRARRATAGAPHYWRVTRFLLESERSGDALALLQRASDLVEHDDDLRLLRAVALAEARQVELALIEVDSIIAQRPDLENALELRATLLGKQGRADETILAWETVVRLHPSNPRGTSGLGLALVAAKRHGEAIQVLRQAVADHPWSGELYLHLATALREAARLDEAETVVRRAIELDTNSARNQHELGLVLEAAGRRDEAAQAFRDALLRDRSVRTYQALARVLELGGHADEAQSVLVQALTHVPRTADHYGEITVALDALRMRNLSGEGMFAGSLAAFSVWQVLELAHNHRSVGKIELVLADAKAEVFVREGALVRVRTDQMRPLLEVVLSLDGVDRARIGRGIAAGASDVTVAQVLRRLNLVDDAKLKKAIEHQTMQALAAFVNRQDGSFAFRQQAVDTEPSDVALGIQHVLLELARIQDEAQR